MAWFVPSRSLPLQSNGSSILWSRLLRYSGAGVGCARTAGDLHLTANVRQSHALQPCLRQSGNGLCVNVLLELSKGDPINLHVSGAREPRKEENKGRQEGKKKDFSPRVDVMPGPPSHSRKYVRSLSGINLAKRGSRDQSRNEASGREPARPRELARDRRKPVAQFSAPHTEVQVELGPFVAGQLTAFCWLRTPLRCSFH